MEENTMILGTSKTSITTIKWNNIANAESSTLPPSSGSHSFWLSIRCNSSGNTTIRRTSHTQTANHLHNQLIATFKLEQSTQKGNKLRTVLVHQHSQVTRLFWSCILDAEFTTLFKVCYVKGTRVTKVTKRFN